MSAPINDGGPAFPLGDSMLDYVGSSHAHANGMSLRDYFAARAMEGLLSGQFMELARACDETKQKVDEMVARTAYHHADAMLKARSA